MEHRMSAFPDRVVSEMDASYGTPTRHLARPALTVVSSVIVASILCTLRLVAQTPASVDGGPARLAFDVVSIKPPDPHVAGTPFRAELGGRFSGTVTAEFLIQMGFRGADRLLYPQQIVGAPDWVRSERFSITGVLNGSDRPDRATFASELPVLLRSLIEDRFKLVAHSEMRSLPVYALVLAKSDGRLGPQLKAAPDCSANGPSSAAGVNGTQRICGQSTSRPGAFSSTGLPLSGLLGPLTVASGRMVVDRTGLAGRYDVDLRWSPNLTADSSDAPTIFAAVQEQLGLKLESTMAPVNTVVIDHIERPSPD